MSNRNWRKKRKTGKVILGLSVGVILVGLGAGTFYLLDQNKVSAEQTENKEETKTENKEEIETVSTEELEAKISALEASKKELQTKLDALTADKTNLQTEISELEETIVANQASIGALESQIEALDANIATLTSEKEALEADAEANEARIAELDASIATLTSEKETLQTELTAKESTIASLNNQVIDLQTQIQNLESQIENLSGSKPTLSVATAELSVNAWEYNYHLDKYSGDVTSLDAEGNPIEFKTFVSEAVQNGTVQYKDVYYFNGTPENGSYATRRFYLNTDTYHYKISVKDNILAKNIVSLDLNTTLDYSDILIESNSNLFSTEGMDKSMVEYSIQNMETYETLGWMYNDGENTQYTFSTPGVYTIGINNMFVNLSNGMGTNPDGSIIVFVDTPAAYKVETYSYSGDYDTETNEITSVSFDSEGNYQIQFNAFGDADTYSITIPEAYLEDILYGDIDSSSIIVSSDNIRIDWTERENSVALKEYIICVAETDGGNSVKIRIAIDVLANDISNN